MLLSLLAALAHSSARAQSISLINVPAEIGSGLQSFQISAQLSDSQHGGTTVHVASADTLRALLSSGSQLPGTAFLDIFVPNGSANANFFLQALEATSGVVAFTASASGFASAMDSTEIVEPSVELTAVPLSGDVSAPPPPFRVRVGVPNVSNTTLQQIQAARAGGPGLTATVFNSNAAAAQLVTQALTGQTVSVIILPGQSHSPATVPTGGVAIDGIGSGGVTELTAAIPGFNPTAADTATVTLIPSSIAYTGTPLDVGAGLRTNQKRINLSGSAHGGVTVHVESSDSTRVLISPSSFAVGSGSLDLAIADGNTQAILYVHGVEGNPGPAVLTATAPDFIAAVESLQVVTPGLRMVGLFSPIDTFDPPDLFVVEVGVPKSDLSTLSIAQPVRPGGVALTASVASSDTVVGKIAVQAGTFATATAPIAVGNFSTPGSLPAGGVAFDGVGLGSTLVHAEIPGFTTTSAGSLLVDVTQPGITMTNMPIFGVGSGLQSPVARATLEASEHGGVDVTIFSDDPSRILLATHPDSAAADTVVVELANGLTLANFYIHALEGVTGSATITAQVPGFSDGSASVDNVVPGIRIRPADLPGSLDTLDPPDPFRIEVGIPINADTNVQPQLVRTGGVPVVASVSLDDSTLARLLTLPDSSHAVTVTIPVGASLSPSTVLSGGVALDGLAPGAVTVTAAAPAFLSVADAIRVISITAPSTSVTGLPTAIGAGLISSSVTLSLSTPNHGGVVATLTSSDPSIALLSHLSFLNGGGQLIVPISDGSAEVEFHIHGVDGATGNPTIDIDVTQFVGTQISPQIVQPAVAFVGLPSTIDVTDAPPPVIARVGIPDLGNSTVLVAQRRRPGVAPLEVTLSSSAPAKAILETLLASGDSVTVEIESGETDSPPSSGFGGATLHALAEGQTIVFGSIPGFIQTGAAQQQITITNSSIEFLGLPARLGSGLQTDVVTAQLGSAGHGGVTVHVAVDDTSKARVSASPFVLGGESVDVPLLNGETDAPYYLQALGGAPDTLVVTASAPGFATEIASVLRVPSALEIAMLADSMLVMDPDDPFVVRLGAIRADSAGIEEMQLLRPGASPVDVTVFSKNGPVGSIETSSTSGDSAIVSIGVGLGETPASVLAGGVAFRPLAAGSTSVTATATGFVSPAAATQIVIVVAAPTGIEELTPSASVTLHQNFPNPFNPLTQIRFGLPEAMQIELAVFDLQGRHVVTLIDGPMRAGTSTVRWNARDARGAPIGSGIYFYRLRTEREILTRKLLLLK